MCDEWLNFQVFAKWHEKHSYEVNERLHLDKDILYPGNKVYSPEKCLLVSQRINELFAYKPKDNGLPVGIYKTNNGRFGAKYCGCNLGTYSTLEEAYKNMLKRKKKLLNR